jgi:acetyltransferase-like isoleucine patch superfamily enzyme
MSAVRKRWPRAFYANVRRDLTPPPPAAFAGFGKGSVILPPARVTMPNRIRIGENVVIHEGAWLSMEIYPDGPPWLEIGHGVRFGRGLCIACIGQVVIADNVLAADDVFIADSFHDYRDPDVPVIVQPMSPPAPVTIGRGAYLGAGAVVLPGTSVGEGAYVGEGAVVISDVPARGVVYGIPARPGRPAPRAGS